MIVTLDNARRIISAAYPDMLFKIRQSCCIGVRPVYDPRPTLAWRRLDGGRDSAVRIGRMMPGNDIDWDWSPTP